MKRRMEDKTMSREYVDLGLSVKWATMNIGADTLTDPGTYFAWGETGNKDDYTWDTYQHGTSAEDITKYNYEDNKTMIPGNAGKSSRFSLRAAIPSGP